MVRLKELVAEAKELQSSVFQFHHGTIKSASSILITDTTVLFQFHHGTIKRLTNYFKELFRCEISIPSWYD